MILEVIILVGQNVSLQNIIARIVGANRVARGLIDLFMHDCYWKVALLYIQIKASLIAYSGRSRPRFRRDADRHSGLMATGIPAGSRPLFRSNPTGCL
jgi:hypothetical protein